MAIYDWRKELGEIPEAEIKRPGRVKGGGHPMMDALKAPSTRKRAIAVLTKLLLQAEGNLGDLAGLLDSSWHSAQRAVAHAGLGEFAGTLRLEHGRAGPTGHGMSKRPPRTPGGSGKRKAVPKLRTLESKTPTKERR